jgi:hypothetical protein
MQPSSLHYLIEAACAAHCERGGSNKDWAGVLVHVVATGETTDAPEEARTWMVLSVYGKSGGTLQGGQATPLTTRKIAETAYRAKVREKLGKHGYTEIDFAPFLSAFQVPLEWPARPLFPAQARPGEEIQEAPGEPERAGLSELRAGEASDAPGELPQAKASSLPPPSRLPYVASRVEAVTDWYMYTDPRRYGVTEKANGERCLLASEGDRLLAFNRNGDPATTVPAAAQALLSFGKPFVVDGERLVGEQTGQYAIFDLLSFGGEDLRWWPYEKRIVRLAEALYGKGLIKLVGPTPTLKDAATNSRSPGLLLLTPVGGTAISAVVSTLRMANAEGIIIRTLAARYDEARAVLKYKFTSDLDAVVIGVKPGAAGGSLKLGLRRPGDNAVIACGHVRSGLTQEDMRYFTDRLLRGEWSVLKVEYLPARTAGVVVVEGRTSRAWERSDKAAWDCTTDQLGSAKARLVNKAPRVPGIAFPQPSSRTTAEQALAQPRSWEAPALVTSHTPAGQQANAKVVAALSPTSQEMQRARMTQEAPLAPPMTPSASFGEAAAVSLPELLPGTLIPFHVRTDEDALLVARCLSGKKTILLDVRAKNLLKTAWKQQPDGLAQQALRARWGMKYLALGHSLGDARDLNRYAPVQLLTPQEGMNTLRLLLAQGHTVLLMCACQPERGHLQHIIAQMQERCSFQVATPEEWLAAQSAAPASEALPALVP